MCIDLAESQLRSKICVGHNALLDLLFIMHQFYDEMPPALSSFKERVSMRFPFLVDTKVALLALFLARVTH